MGLSTRLIEQIYVPHKDGVGGNPSIGCEERYAIAQNQNIPLSTIWLVFKVRWGTRDSTAAEKPSSR